jgi:hypothetical protein
MEKNDKSGDVRPELNACENRIRGDPLQYPPCAARKTAARAPF